MDVGRCLQCVALFAQVKKRTCFGMEESVANCRSRPTPIGTKTVVFEWDQVTRQASVILTFSVPVMFVAATAQREVRGLVFNTRGNRLAKMR